MLTWERNGFVVWYKRLERQKFHWPRRGSETVLTLNGEQLHWLLDGYDVWRMKGMVATVPRKDSRNEGLRLWRRSNY
jgi:transposase